MMATSFLRDASPNEKRCIIRHELGFYSNIAIAGIYLIPRKLVEVSRLQQTEFYAVPLIDCIQQHPFLSTVIQKADTNHPAYARPHDIDLRARVRHLQLDGTGLNADEANNSENDLIQQFLERIHNDITLRFTSTESEPAWALDVLLLPTRSDPDFFRVLISYTYSHSHGDGISGIIFHQTYCEALERCLTSSKVSQKLVTKSPGIALPDQPDTSSTLPISLSYLLMPALGTYLPAILIKWLGISGSVSGANDETWTGSSIFIGTVDNEPNVRTNVEILEIEAQLLNQALELCRQNDIKLTALLNHLIAQVMHEKLDSLETPLGQYTNFIANVPVNLRKALQVPPNTIGNFGGAAYLRCGFDSVSTPIDECSWEQMRTGGRHLSRVAASTQNQPIGLLRFVSNFASWMRDKVGHTRDCSWELSNLGSFDQQHDTGLSTHITRVNIQKLAFSQPASPIGPPITYNVLGTKGGSLTICICWQPGALYTLDGANHKAGIDLDGGRNCIKAIATSIKAKLAEITSIT